MSARQTWFWLALAVGLFAFIFFVRPGPPHGPGGPPRVLPELKRSAVTAVQVRPGGPIPLAIKAERTNQTWELTEPLVYPALATNIENLLSALEGLTAATMISPAEMRSRPNADEEFGFAAPQASILLQQTNASPARVLFGAKTVPGDQVFLQVVGREGAYVVDADVLKLIPGSANDWRDTAVVQLAGVAFDYVAVTNNGKWFVLQRSGAERSWRMISPMTARADNDRIIEALQGLKDLRVEQFVSDDPRTDLEALGLAPAELALTLGLGTNRVVSLQFGKSPTNATSQVFARRAAEPTVFTVASNLVAAWRAPVNEFRDPHLLVLSVPVEAVEARGKDTFTIQREGKSAWRIQPQNLPADEGLVSNLLATLTNMTILSVAKDAVTAPDLPDYGLAQPARQYALSTAPASMSAPGTNGVVAELRFGLATNQTDRVFAMRADESTIYAVSTNEFARLPAASWQMRQRQVWRFSEEDVLGLDIHQQGRHRQIIRADQGEWSLASGSQGIIVPLAVEATVGGLVGLSADVWVGRGAETCAQYGIQENGHIITLVLKDGSKSTVKFGGEAPSHDQYAAVDIDGEVWIMEFPWRLYQDVQRYLSAP
jgi:hypothetical protein